MIQSIFLALKISWAPLIRSSLTPPTGNHSSFTVSSFAFSIMSYTWNYAMLNFLNLASLTQQHAFEIYPCVYLPFVPLAC